MASSSGPELISAAQHSAVQHQLMDVTAERDRLARERDQLAHERDQLAHERDEYKDRADWLFKQLERLRYDAKTPRERVDPRQIQFVFASFAQALLGSSPAPSTESTPPAGNPGGGGEGKKPKRNNTPHGRRPLPEHLPVETILITPSPLPEGARQVSEDVSWRLGFRRASYYRLRIVRPVFVVPKDEADQCTGVDVTLFEGTTPPDASAASTQAPEREPKSVEIPSGDAVSPMSISSTSEDARDEAQSAGSGSDHEPSTPPAAPSVDTPGTTIVSAPAPDEMIPRGLPTPDLLAHVVVSKFADKLPFNRQEGIIARSGVAVTRGTMCGWTEAAHDLARLVVDAAVADGREHAHVIATDATGVLVQANEKCKKGHFWVYVLDRDHVIFRYSKVHSSNEPKTFFQGFKGTVLSDASNVFDVLFGLPDSPEEANCWSHARRYFYKAIESENPDEALIGVGFCNQLFALEREWKKLPPDKRLEMRRQRAAPVVAMLERWKDEQLANPRIAEGSRLRKALNYLTNQWPALCTFLSNGRVPIHNNESERQLRSLVVGRANWLFVGSDDTAEWTCTFVSLVASCQLHGIDPEQYLRDLFRVLPVWPKNRMLELAPKFWRATRALLDENQLALPLGPVTVPPARVLREPAPAAK